jgi:ABC-type multidrug transport system fused ATPase/permease subunit
MGLTVTSQTKRDTPLSVARPREESELRRVYSLLVSFSGGRRLYLLALVMLAFEAVTAIFQPYPLAYLIDFLQGERPPLSLNLPFLSDGRTETVAILTGSLLLLTMVNSLADSLAEIFLARAGRVLGFNIRAKLHAHLQRLSLAFHDQRRTGDMLTRVTSDVTAVEDFVVKSVSDLAGSLLVLAGTLAFLFYKSWLVAVIAILIVPLLATISNHYSQRIKIASKRQRAREGDFASAAQEMLTSIRVIQTYGRADYETERFSTQSRQAMEASLVTASLQARFSWVVAVLEALAIGAVVWAGLWLIDRNTITVGTLILFTVLIQNMFKPTRKIIREWSTIGKIFASVERIGEILDREPAVVDAPNAVPAPTLAGRIAFDDVNFAYELEVEDAEAAGGSSRRVALHEVNFEIAPGQVFGLVGHSGAGKSTIAQLIPRLYDPDAGTVRIDGLDIRSLTLESLRAQISVVLQDTLLFSGTVAENIAYGMDDATREQIIEAAIRANADSFIRELPDGYDTVLGERAANLSGGQRQRISIARAFIRDTPILILDEPTTGLDAAATEQVLLGLHSLMQDKTTVIITHNLSLLQSTDCILVIDGGQIVERGTHTELLANGATYAQYYAKQSGAPLETPSQPNREVLPLGTTNGEARAASGPHRFALKRESLVEVPKPLIWLKQSRRPTAPATVGLDPLKSRRLHATFPGLRPALRADVVGAELQAQLLRDGVEIDTCKPGKALYLGPEGCSLRFDLTVRDSSSTGVQQLLVLARLLHDDDAVERYRAAVAPLEDAMRDRPEAASFARLSATLPKRLVVHPYPIDPDLPTLVRATDSALAAEVLGEPEEHCSVALGHYGRRHRCVLRYERDARYPIPLVYGKVYADDRGARVGPTLAALATADPHNAVVAPRFLGYRDDLRLSLLQELSGRREPAVAMLDGAARVAAALHRVDVPFGSVRSIDRELAELDELVQLVQGISPGLGSHLRKLVAQIATVASESEPLALVFSHGDFTHSQLLMAGGRCGLVDYDSIAWAEPALDLGQFIAYLRLTVTKTAPFAGKTRIDQLADRFLDAYLAGAAAPVDRVALRTRVQVYEAISLVRTTVHSWQKLKGPRLRTVFPILEEGVKWLSSARS